MKVTLKYFAQVRQAAGQESEQVELPKGCDLLKAIEQVANAHGDPFRSTLLSGDGSVRPSLLLLVNEVPAPRGSPRVLKEGDEIRVFSPVAGG